MPTRDASSMNPQQSGIHQFEKQEFANTEATDSIGQLAKSNSYFGTRIEILKKKNDGLSTGLKLSKFREISGSFQMGQIVGKNGEIANKYCLSYSDGLSTPDIKSLTKPVETMKNMLASFSELLSSMEISLSTNEQVKNNLSITVKLEGEFDTFITSKAAEFSSSYSITEGFDYGKDFSYSIGNGSIGISGKFTIEGCMTFKNNGKKERKESFVPYFKF